MNGVKQARPQDNVCMCLGVGEGVIWVGEGLT